MSQNKSLKLLNYATNNGGFLELYTELDHNFKAGDKIFIVGGYYDNTEDLSYISSYPSFLLSDPFALNKNGYTIKTVNNANNSIVLNYPAGALIYPYGTALNIKGDPTDLVNLAYNTYSGNDLYKSVYISKSVFLNGEFRQGTINNGIFGNDYHTVKLNLNELQLPSVSKNDIIINHIVSKNTSISKCIINSKTDQLNLPSTKFKIDEDNLTLFPFQQVTVGNNNNGYGYSSFEKIKIYGNSTISNGIFNNPLPNNIDLTNIIFTKSIIGGNEPYLTNANKISNSSSISGQLYNSTLDGLFTFGGNIVNTFTNLNVISAVWGVTAGEIILNVSYDTVANKIWPLTTCYLSGINPLNNSYNSDQHDICRSTATITDVTYIYGDLTSAYITIIVDNLINDWVTWSATYTPANFNFSKAKLSILNLENLYTTNDCIISGSLYSNTNNIYIQSLNKNVTITEGKFEGIIYDANINFNGSNYGESILLINTKQMYQSTVVTLPSFNYVDIQITQAAIKGNFEKCKIVHGSIQNSIMNDSYIVPALTPYTTPYALTPNIYLYNSDVTGSSIVDDTVYWDLVRFKGKTDTYINNNFGPYVAPGAKLITYSNFGARKTPWKTGPVLVAPLNPLTSKSIEYNKIEGIQAAIVYNSQEIIKTPILPNIPGSYKQLKYHVPTLQFVQTVIDTTKYMTIVDRGDMVNNGFLWQILIPKTDVLFNDILDNNNTLKTKILNRNTYNISGIIDTDFPGVDPLTATNSQTRRVDTNFVYEYNNYYNNYTTFSVKSDIRINVYDSNPPVPSGQPDPSYTLSLVPFLKIVGTITYDNILPGSTNNIDSDNYIISFRSLGPSIEDSVTLPGPTIIYFPIPATNAPACFIEIERVIIKYYDSSNNLRAYNITNTNYCPQTIGEAENGIEYSWDTLVIGNNYSKDFEILKPPYTLPTNKVGFNSSTGTNANKAIIDIEYWVTWYNTPASFILNADKTFSGIASTGKREKKIDTYTFIANPS